MTQAVKMLTPKALAERWDNSHKVGTLANWRAQKKGPPYIKRGAKVLYPLEQLVAWENANPQFLAANDNTES